VKKDRSVDRQTITLFWRGSLRYKRSLMWGVLFPVGIIALNVIAPLFIGKTLALDRS